MGSIDEDLIHKPAWFEVRFQLSALQEGRVPRFLGPVMHGAFGHALEEACDTYPEASNMIGLCYCSHESGRPPPGHPNWCQPFTFDIDLNQGGEVSPGTLVRGTLIGKPVLASNASFFPALLLAIQIMARNGLGPDLVPFDVSEINILPNPIFLPRHEGISIYPALYEGEHLLKKREVQQRAAIKVKTPTQLVHKGQVLHQMDGPVFFRRLWQRIVAWADVDVGTDIKPPFFDEVQVEEDQTWWWKVERFSTRQHKRLSISGLVGRVVFSGLDPFSWSLLCLGEKLHVGKSTTSGLGKYTILRDG